MNFARYIDALVSFIAGKRRVITKNIVASALDKNYYDNSKVSKELTYTFIPVNESLRYLAKTYLFVLKRM